MCLPFLFSSPAAPVFTIFTLGGEKRRANLPGEFLCINSHWPVALRTKFTICITPLSSPNTSNSAVFLTTANRWARILPDAFQETDSQKDEVICQGTAKCRHDQGPRLSRSKMSVLPPHPMPLEKGLTCWLVPPIFINSMLEAGVHDGNNEQDGHQIAFTGLRVHKETDNAMLWGLRAGEQAGRFPRERWIYFQAEGIACTKAWRRENGLCMELQEVWYGWNLICGPWAMTDKGQSMQSPVQQAKEFGLNPKENGEPLRCFKEDQSRSTWVLEDKWTEAKKRS